MCAYKCGDKLEMSWPTAHAVVDTIYVHETCSYE